MIGVVGSFIGTFIAQRLEFRFDGFLGSLLVSSVGAIFFLAVLGIVSSIFRRPA
ncbi:Transglycosylase associated protein [compost metagenome]